MIREIYFAAGCFWGVEKLFSSVDGVIQAISGYANGISEDKANYKDVCKGNTGFREAVRVKYDSDFVSLENLLFLFFSIVRVEQENGQANDIGEQYKAGIYYTDDYSERIIERIVKVEKEYYSHFYVETKPLENFYMAEDYHQEYLTKNPGGYCHIGLYAINKLKNIRILPEEYTKAAKLIRQDRGYDI